MIVEQRIDKWLWIARLVKTRTLASKSVSTGTVRLNGTRTHKPSKIVHVGDVITLVQRDQVRIFEIKEFSDKRGPYEKAKLLYDDISPPPLERSKQAFISRPAEREKGAGRPTKKQRRDMTAWTTFEPE